MIPLLLPLLFVSVTDPLFLPFGESGDLYPKRDGNLYVGVLSLIHYTYGLSDQWNVNMGNLIFPPGLYIGAKRNILSKKGVHLSLGGHYFRGSFDFLFFDEEYYSFFQVFGSATQKRNNHQFTISPMLYSNSQDNFFVIFFADHLKFGEGQVYLEGITLPHIFPGGIFFVGFGPYESKFRFDFGGAIAIGEDTSLAAPFLRLGYRF